MNSGDFFPKSELESGGKLSSASRRLARALRNALSGKPASRRSGGRGNGRAESLEVRQVLSVANPMLALTPDSLPIDALDAPIEVEGLPEQISDGTVILVSAKDGFLKELQGQLSAAVSTNWQNAAITQQSSFFGLSHALNVGDSNLPGAASRANSFGEVSEQSRFDVSLAVEIRFDWNDGPIEVVVIGSSETGIQVAVSGLASSPLASVSRPEAELLLQRTTIAALRSHESARGSSLTFRNLSAIHPDSAAALLHQPQRTANVILPPVTEMSPNASAQSGSMDPGLSAGTPTTEVDRNSLIDEVFGDSNAVLDTPLLLPPIISDSDAATPTDVPPAESNRDDSFDAIAHRTDGNLFVPFSVSNSFISTDVAGIDRDSETRSAVDHGSWRGTLSPHPSIGELNYRAVLSNPERTLVSTLVPGGPFSGTSVWSEGVQHANHWITWLTGESVSLSVAESAESEPSLSARVAPNASAADAQGELNRTRTKLRLASSEISQNLSRRLRESHRQATHPEQLDWVSPHEFEPLDAFRLDNVPGQLKYVADPRGPPVYGRDANVPLVDPEAPASLLERLRYSIAPRGPSLVTVEMQSPEFPSFSGPRVSPEELQFKLAC